MKLFIFSKCIDILSFSRSPLIKINFKHKNVTYWLHILNATNTYYATMATKNFSVKGNAAYSYYIGEPRSIAIGFNWSILGIQ
jgi:hypothetical protein